MARSYAKGVIDTAYKRQIRPPDVILRGHVHRKTWESVTDQITGHRAEMIIGPGWQWKTEFVYRMDTIDKIADVGLTMLRVRDGRVLSVKFETIKAQQTREITA